MTLPKRIIFRKSCKGVGWGVIFNKKNHVPDFRPLKRALSRCFPKFATQFSHRKGGGGQRLFGTFPKIHPFWYHHPSLSSCAFSHCMLFCKGCCGLRHLEKLVESNLCSRQYSAIHDQIRIVALSSKMTTCRKDSCRQSVYPVWQRGLKRPQRQVTTCRSGPLS